MLMNVSDGMSKAPFILRGGGRGGAEGEAGAGGRTLGRHDKEAALASDDAVSTERDTSSLQIVHDIKWFIAIAAISASTLLN